MVTTQYHMMYLFVRYIVTHQLQICADPFFTSSNTFGKVFSLFNFLSNCIKSCEITKVSHSLSKNTSNSKDVYPNVFFGRIRQKYIIVTAHATCCSVSGSLNTAAVAVVVVRLQSEPFHLRLDDDRLQHQKELARGPT